MVCWDCTARDFAMRPGNGDVLRDRLSMHVRYGGDARCALPPPTLGLPPPGAFSHASSFRMFLPTLTRHADNSKDSGSS